jgi:TPR repeat protein
MAKLPPRPLTKARWRRFKDYSMLTRLALAGFMLASATLFAQLSIPAKPCPAGTSVPDVKGAAGFQPVKVLTSAAPKALRTQENSLEHLAYFTVPEGGAACDIYVIGEAAPDNIAVIVEALSLWRFTPAQAGGKAVATRASVSFNPRAARVRQAVEPEYEQALRLINTGTEAEQKSGIQKLEALSANGLAQADSYLGLMLATGTRVTQDAKRGLQLVQRAALKEDRFAFYAMGVLLEQGKVVAKDDSKAATAFEQAAVRGMVQAQEKLGEYYANGKGISKNVERAAALYRLCAAAGRNSCAFSLAELLHREGKHLDEALAWALLAKLRGAQAADALAREIEAKVSADKRLLAQSFASVIANTRPPRQ